MSRDTDAFVFVAGHRGMVGSAILRLLQDRGVETVMRSRAEFDLTDQNAVRKFMEKDSGFKVIEEDRDIVAEVAKTPGALGYIRVKPINENIRVLLVIP